MQSNFSITWCGHSCFKVEYGNYSIVLDPYDDVIPGYTSLNLAANMVLCSHQHSDHNCERVVHILPSRVDNPFTVSTVESMHDDAGGKLRGMNTIHILEANGIRLAHLGDLGCMLDEKQLEQIGDVDVLMIPVGGHYTIDAELAKKIADRMNPTVTIPMHYRGQNFGYDVLATVNDFVSLCNDVIAYDTDTILITKGMLKQTAVLKTYGVNYQ